MSALIRSVTPGVRLRCETLEDRATPAAAYALSGAALLSFDTTDPADTSSTAVTGVAAGETLVGIDFRSADGLLYGLGVNGTTDKATLYTISLETGAATAVGTAGAVAFVDATGKPVDLPAAASTGYAVSFDPSADQLRVVTGSGLNFRVDPATGAPIDGDTGLAGSVGGVNPDGAINGLPTGSTGVAGVAFAGIDQTGAPATQYTLDPASDSLFIQGAGNSGTQTGKLAITLNGEALDFTAVRGFDIPDAAAPGAPAPGTAVAALAVGGTTRVYEIDLATGAATEVGAAPAGAKSLVLSTAVPKTVEFTSATFTGTEVGRNAEIALTRTGDLSEELTVSVLVTGGTATEGIDFTGAAAAGDALVVAGTSFVVTFAAGSATATLNIPIVDDHTAEPNETITLTLSAPSAGAVGAQATAEVTIEDSGTPAPMPTEPLITADSVVVGTGRGFGAVWVLNPDGTPRAGFLPYGDTMLAGVKVATADVNGDGVKDIITAPGLFLSHIKVFDGATGAEIGSFNAFDPAWFFLGVNIAAGDVNGDGKAEVIVATATGSTHVKVFDGATGAEGLNFYAFAGSLSGVTIAAGDVNGDGRADLVAGTAGGLSYVKAINLNGGAVIQTFVAYPGYGYGVSVGVGDVDGDGQADIVTGTAGVGAQVKVFNGRTGAQSQNYFAFPMAFGGGVHVAAKDVTGDGIPDVLVSAASTTDQTKFFDGATGKELRNFLAFGIGFPGGVFIG